MQTGGVMVSFKKRAAVDLADNEKVSLWEPTQPGFVEFQKDAIQLNGAWRLSAIANFLGGGILGDLFIKPLLQKSRAETISVLNLERAVIHRKKKDVTFHLFQTRDQGMVEVHVFELMIFAGDKDPVPPLIESLKALVPASLLQEQNAG